MVSVLACGLAGVRHTAGWQAEWEQTGMLPSLRQANLRPLETMGGVLAAKALLALTELLPLAPVAVLLLVLSGPSVGELLRVGLLLVTTLLASLAVGLLGGSLGRGRRRWANRTLWLLGAWLVWLPAAGVAWDRLGGCAGVHPWLLAASPLAACSAALDGPAGGDSHNFRRSVGLCLGVGLVAFAGACGRSRGHWGGWPPSSRAEAASPVGSRLAGTGGAAARAERTPLWVIAPVALAALSVFVLALGSPHSADLAWACGALYTAHLSGKVLLAWEANLALRERRSSGALLVELTTPLSAAELLAGTHRVLEARFRPPLGLLALTNAAALVALSLRTPRGLGPEGCLALALGLGLGLVQTFLDAPALAWFGMSAGLRAGSALAGLGATLGTVVLLPWTGLAALGTLNAGNYFTNNEVVAYALCWGFLGGALSLGVGVAARDRLTRDLRLLAAG